MLAVQRKGLLPASSGGRKAAAPGKGRKSKAKAESRGSANATGEGLGEEEGGGGTKLGGGGVPKEEVKPAAATPKADSRSRKALVGKKAELLPNSAEQTPSKVKSEAITKARPGRAKPEATKARPRGKAKAVPKASLDVAYKAKAEASAAAAVAKAKRGRLGDDRTAAVAEPRAGKRSKRAVAVKSEGTPAAAEAADGSVSKLSVGRRSPRLASIVDY